MKNFSSFLLLVVFFSILIGCNKTKNKDYSKAELEEETQVNDKTMPSSGYIKEENVSPSVSSSSSVSTSYSDNSAVTDRMIAKQGAIEIKAVDVKRTYEELQAFIKNSPKKSIVNNFKKP